MVEISLEQGQTDMRKPSPALNFWSRATSALLAIMVLAVTGATSAPAQQGKTIEVLLDRAEVAPLPARTSTLIVGNPMIADANVQSSGMIVITGKGIGSTNVMALDAAGAILSNVVVRVRGGRAETIQVYRGADRETYQCSPACEPIVTLGDSKEHFDRTIAQSSVRLKSAQEQGASDRR